ncbi:MFS transporter, MCP family, solute carrier family 16, member 10 [Rhizodiscina lignyota]|uniref:MFS transporter, MCP family, solute carrier family 16, member 10 n=1 Tax=Rhizodiscina lignyota TaxID=1504668 RepID=A0A9P4IQ04_9PEZI|nr:MFS transporter, MCP family, solute carrier family 16, member 10 [Rhizodiscina lignyota]
MTTRSIVNPGPPPDGGIKAWTQVAMGWIVIFTTWGYVNSFGAFQPYYTSTLPGVNASTVSWIGSIQVWLTFFIGAFSGRMLDAGLFVPAFCVGAVLQLLGIFMMSLSTKYWQLVLTQGIMTGLGGGIFFCPALGLVATYFSKRRAMAIAIASTGNAVGGMIYPVLAKELLGRIGFAWTTRVLGFVNLAGLLVCAVFMRPRLPPRRSGPIIDWTAWKEPMYVLFVIGMMATTWALYFCLYYLASFAINVTHLPYTTSTTLIIIVNGVGVPARLIPPLFANRYGLLNTFIPLLLSTALLTYLQAAITSTTGLYIWTVVYGMSNAAFQCLVPTTAASLCNDLSRVGTRLGMLFSCMSFAALTGPPIGGAIIGSLGSGREGYIAAVCWAGSAALLGVVLIYVGRVWVFGWSWKVKV